MQSACSTTGPQPLTKFIEPEKNGPKDCSKWVRFLCVSGDADEVCTSFAFFFRVHFSQTLFTQPLYIKWVTSKGNNLSAEDVFYLKKNCLHLALKQCMKKVKLNTGRLPAS